MTSVAASRDGARVASSGADGTVRIWDTHTGKACATLTGHGEIWTVAFDPEGAWLASAGVGGMVQIWATVGRQPAALMRVDGQVRTCAWLPRAHALAVGGSGGLYLFDSCLPPGDRSVAAWPEPATNAD